MNACNACPFAAVCLPNGFNAFLYSLLRRYGGNALMVHRGYYGEIEKVPDGCKGYAAFVAGVGTPWSDVRLKPKDQMHARRQRAAAEKRRKEIYWNGEAYDE